MLTPDVLQVAFQSRPRSARRRTRRFTGIAVALVLTVGTSACTPDVNAAAVVGGTSISSARVDERTGTNVMQAGQAVSAAQGLNTALMNQTLVDAGRVELNTQIRHQLLAASGLEQNLDQQTLLQFADQLGGVQTVAQQLGVYTTDDLLSRLNDLAAEAGLVSDALTSGQNVPTPTVTFDFLIAADYDTAVTLKAEYDKDPALLSAAAAVGSSDTAGVQETVTPDIAAALIQTGIFTAARDQIVLFDLSGTVFLARVTDTKVVDQPLNPAALSSPNASVISAAAGLILADLAADVRVEVNPRYGVWDATTMQVISEPGRR